MADSDATAWDLGDCRVTLIPAGSLRLDGGAMFGIIPKVLWERHTPADERNRIPLACNSLLVQWPESDRLAIIETGHGAKFSAKEQDIFAIDPQHWLRPALLERGIEPDRITDVIVTHLHFDHAGGLTWCPHPDAPAVPTFPRARVHVQGQEFDDARANFGIMTATYREENFAPIDAAGAWNLLAGEGTVVPGIDVLSTPGHTRGHQSVLVRGRRHTIVYTGDVMPTAAHVGAAWNMAYDLFPLDNRASKRRLLSRAAEHGWLLLIDHEPSTPLVRVRPDGEWFALEPAQL